MSAPELTPWFPAGTQPARGGMYQTRQAGQQGCGQYQRWDGSRWLAWAVHFPSAAELPRDVSCRQQPEWRGLAKEPA